MESKPNICDVCLNPNREVTTYTVTAGERQRDAVRCSEHGYVLEAILAGESATPLPRGARPARRGGTPRPQVITLDEIERRKNVKPPTQ